MQQRTSTTAIAPRWVPAGALDVLLHNQAASHGGLLSAEARAAIKEALEQAKSRGNQSYAAQRYDEALVFYQQAQRADPRNTTQMLHAVLSNMSAVHATQGNWRKSFHHVRARARAPLRLVRTNFGNGRAARSYPPDHPPRPTAAARAHGILACITPTLGPLDVV